MSREWLALREPATGKPFWYHVASKTKVWSDPHQIDKDENPIDGLEDCDPFDLELENVRNRRKPVTPLATFPQAVSESHTTVELHATGQSEYSKRINDAKERVAMGVQLMQANAPRDPDTPPSSAHYVPTDPEAKQADRQCYVTTVLGHGQVVQTIDRGLEPIDFQNLTQVIVRYDPHKSMVLFAAEAKADNYARCVVLKQSLYEAGALQLFQQALIEWTPPKPKTPKLPLPKQSKTASNATPTAGNAVAPAAQAAATTRRTTGMSTPPPPLATNDPPNDPTTSDVNAQEDFDGQEGSDDGADHDGADNDNEGHGGVEKKSDTIKSMALSQ